MRKTKRYIWIECCNLAKWMILLNIVAEIVTLCEDSLHVDWTLIITGIDANIEYTIVALSHRTSVLCLGRWRIHTKVEWTYESSW